MPPVILDGGRTSPGAAEAIARAIEAGEIVPWYQPVLDLTTEQVVAVEALARWTGPTGEVEPTAAFIDVAERSDLIIDLDRSIMRQALADLAGWTAAGHDVRLSLNLSGRHLDRSDWIDTLQTAVTTAALEPGRVWLELTETLRPDRADAGADQLRQVRALGFAVWLDDFGTGWAALSDLLRLPAAGLKIDHSFAAALGTPVADAIVRAITGATAELGLGVIIEGIETPEQARRARELGCPYAQGFLWSPAVPAAAVPGLL